MKDDFNLDDLRIKDRPPVKPNGARRSQEPKTKTDNFIGCPEWWLKLVYAARVRTSGQLIVAIYLWKRRAICRSNTFDLPNEGLAKIGVSRKVKYQTLILLAEAGLIRVTMKSKRSAPTVTILAKEPKE
jgi:hypothetical protein